jgi:hypothetical protein
MIGMENISLQILTQIIIIMEKKWFEDSVYEWLIDRNTH